MRRLLITGNSHAGVLRLAWTAMADRPEGVEVDFLNIAAKYSGQMTVSHEGRYGILDERTIAGLDLPEYRKIDGAMSCDLRNYTHVLIAGCFYGFSLILRLLAGHRVDLIREAPIGLPRLSQAAYVAFSQTLALDRLPMARTYGFRPWCKVGLHLAPRLSARIFDDPQVQPCLKVLVEDPTGVPEALALTEAALQRSSAAQGATLFTVPQASLAASGLTLPEYSRDPALPSATGTPDYEHMNADYGSLCLAPVLRWVLA